MSETVKKSSSFLKKLFFGFTAFFGILVILAAVIPFVWDVDQYRPLILSKANEHINGKLDIGKLGLSLWGKIKINIDGLKLHDTKAKSVVEVKEAYLYVPWMSLFTGKPEIRLQLTRPVLHVVKQKDTKLNVMTLVKSQTPPEVQTPSTTAPAAPQAAAPSTTKTTPGLPAIVVQSRLTFLLQNAALNYTDESTKDAYHIRDLNFSLRDVSLTTNMPFELTAQLDLLLQKRMKVAGPLLLKGDLKLINSGAAFDKAQLQLVLKLDDLEIHDPGLFQKKKGVPLGTEVQATIGKDFFQVPVLQLRLAEVLVDNEVSGQMRGEVTTFDFKLKTNQIHIAKLGELIPMIKQYGVNGIVELDAKAQGPTTKVDYAAKVKFNKIALMHESMKQPLYVDGNVDVVTDQVKDLTVKLSAKDFDVLLQGVLQSFQKPHFKFNVASSNMDLDGLLKASEKAALARKEGAASGGASGESTSSAATPTKPAVDYNAMFKPLRENPIAAAAAGSFDFNFRKIKTTGILIQNMKGAFVLNNLLLALKDFSLQIFDGSIAGNMSFNVKPMKPEVGTKVTVVGLQTQRMIEGHMPFAKNTIKGVIGANLNIGGAGLNPADVISDWKGNGSFDVQKAVFTTLDIGREVKTGAYEKMPDFAKSKIKVPDSISNWRGDYELLLTKFALASGILHINEITGKSYPNKGMDLKGQGTVKLADYGLDLSIDLIDRYNLLNGDQIAKDPRYGHFTLSPRVRCTLFKPCFDWAATVEKLAQNAFKQRGAEALQKAIGGKLPPQANQLLNRVTGGSQTSPSGSNEQKPQAPSKQEAVKQLKGLFGR